MLSHTLSSPDVLTLTHFCTVKPEQLILLLCSCKTPDFPLQECPAVQSPWSECMKKLMSKLDQLNLDIEDALSTSPSPSGTPGTARKLQVRNTDIISHIREQWLMGFYYWMHSEYRNRDICHV